MSKAATQAIGLIDTSKFSKVDKSKPWLLTSKHFPVPFWVESVVAASLPYDPRKSTKDIPSLLDVYSSLIKLGYDYYQAKGQPYEIAETDFHLHRSVEPLFCALILAGTRVAQQTPPSV